MPHIHPAAVSVFAAASLFITGILSPASAWASGPVIAGAACQPGQGVTVAVSPDVDGSTVDVRCAVGASGSILNAFQAAGFAMPGDSFVTVIDGVSPSTLYPRGWWVLFTSTTSGAPGGAQSTDWTLANVGADIGPVHTDEAYLFVANEDWNTSASTNGISLGDVVSTTGNTVVAPVAPVVASTANAQTAATWIAGLLASGGDVLSGSGGTVDWGLTIDSIFALASAGVGGDQIAATGAKVGASDTQYIGLSSAVATSWPAIAKMALGLEVAGLDPTAFPTSEGSRNLIADLRSVVNNDGSLGASGTDSVFSHPLAMLALARTTGGVPATMTSWLKAQQCTNAASANVGSYGWAIDCSSPDPDSTAMAIQALQAARAQASDPSIADAATWLVSQQDTSGGVASWGILNSNSTGLVAQALQGIDDGAAQKGAAFIGAVQITCDVVAAHANVLTGADVGAIAYDTDGFQAAAKQGIDQSLASQFARASIQAVLGLGGPTYGMLTGASATSGLPDITCAAPPASVVPQTTTPTAPVTGAPAGGSIAGPSLPVAALVSLLFIAAGVAVCRREAMR